MTPNERKILIAALLASAAISITTAVGVFNIIEYIWSVL